MEDDESILSCLAQLLEWEGYDVICARNGKEARALLNDGLDLIVLDLYMPVMDGREFLLDEGIKALRKNIPVILMTAGKVLEEALPVCCVVRKPMDIDGFLETIKNSALSRTSA